MIGIINYGLGNVKAFANVYKKLNIPAVIVNRADELAGADKLILPGVGSFDYAMQRLDASGLRSCLDEVVVGKEVPVLGVCVGMQMLCRSSEEGKLPGLGWVAGEVIKFDFSLLSKPLPVPHMGWNGVKPMNDSLLFNGLDNASRFYFLHSYYFKAGRGSDVIATADYGGEFSCALNSGNIYGVQFHPEKSHHWGVRLLENFAKL